MAVMDRISPLGRFSLFRGYLFAACIPFHQIYFATSIQYLPVSLNCNLVKINSYFDYRPYNALLLLQKVEFACNKR